jgi:hypothetical protein
VVIFLVNSSKSGPKKSSKLCIAVCVQVKVKAMSKETVDFSLTWNMPKVQFYGQQATYKR